MTPWSVDAMRRCAAEVLAQLTEHIEVSRRGEGPVVRLRPAPELIEELDLERWLRQGGMDAGTLAAFLQRYLDGTTRLHHPHYLAHQVAVPHFASALADLVSGATNNGMSIFEMGPSPASVEIAVVDWMLGLVGWAPTGRGPSGVPAGRRAGGGVLTHGGNLANLTALLAARAACAPEAWAQGVGDELVLLAPATAHYATARAASILGLGARALRALPTDELDRLRPEGVADAIDHERSAGRRVMAVVANACATATGLYDPLDEVGAVCNEREVWFHVDGAHGASALTSVRERGLLAGVERADSLVWDAHKMLQTSTLCAAVLMRDGRRLRDAFELDANYVVDPGQTVGVDVIGHQVECTKGAIGFKLFLTLAFEGEQGMGQHLETLVDRARRFAELIAARPGFLVPCTPESNIVLFGLEDRGVDASALRLALLQRGDYYVTKADVSGRTWLRLTVMNPGSDEQVIAGLLGEIERLVAAGLPTTESGPSADE